MSGIFVTLNLIDKINQQSVFNYPIVYWWNENDSLEDMFNSKEFHDNVFDKISKESFFNVSIYMLYIYENEDGESSIVKKEFALHEMIEFPKEYEDELIKDVLKYLYKCSYKTEPENLDIKFLFDKVKSKYPKKITTDVVMKYMESDIIQKYPNIPIKEIEKLKQKFSMTIL